MLTINVIFIIFVSGTHVKMSCFERMKLVCLRVVPRKTVDVDIEWRFDNLSGNHRRQETKLVSIKRYKPFSELRRFFISEREEVKTAIMYNACLAGKQYI